MVGLPLAIRAAVHVQWLGLLRSRSSQGMCIGLAIAGVWSVCIGADGLAARRAAADRLRADQRAALNRIATHAAGDEARAMRASQSTSSGETAGIPVTVLYALADFYASYPASPAAMLGRPGSALEPKTSRFRAIDDDFVPAFPTAGDKALAGLIPERPIEHPRVPLVGRVDLGFLTIYLLPIAVLALVFDVISGDRDRGTLRLVLASPVRAQSIVGTTALMRTLPVIVAGVIVPAVTSIAVARWAGIPLDTLSVVLWTMAASSYACFWLALSLVVNAVGRSAAVCAAALTAAYVGIVLIVPSAASLTAHVVAPVPSRVTVAEVEREARFEALGPLSGAQDAMLRRIRERFPYREGDEAGQALHRLAAWEEEFDVPIDIPLVAAFVGRTPNIPHRMTAVRLRQTLHAIRADFIESRLAEPLSAIHEARRRAADIVRVFAVASPALAVATALEDLSGTGDVRRERFMDQLDVYARGVRAAVYPALFEGRSVPASMLAARTPFIFSEEPRNVRFRRAMSGLAWPALETIALLCAAFIAVRRLPVDGMN